MYTGQMDWMLVAGAILLAAAAAFAAWAWIGHARGRRLARRPTRRLRHPVVFAHGVFGFDEISVAGRKHRYFRNIASGLGELGNEFHHARVPATASIAVRADRLRELMRSLPCERVNVIAHSMGGLDARYAISRLGLGDRVASLVTIGTPHLGTPLADLGAGVVPAAVSKALSPVFDVRALQDLTVSGLEQFNRDTPDAPGVAYRSVVARSSLGRTNPLLWPSHAFLSARCGPNDGLVPLSSQKWGTVLREIEADHWAQVGWSRRFDAVGMYRDILQELIGLGF
jgi:triacylglycerol lipase